MLTLLLCSEEGGGWIRPARVEARFKSDSLGVMRLDEKIYDVSQVYISSSVFRERGSSEKMRCTAVAVVSGRM